MRGHHQAASGVQSYSKCSPVTSTWKSPTEQSKLLPVEFVWGMLNFSSRCFQWQFWGKGKPGPIKKVRQTEGRLLRNSTSLASDPDLHFSPTGSRQPLKVVEIVYANSWSYPTRTCWWKESTDKVTKTKNYIQHSAILLHDQQYAFTKLQIIWEK